MAPDTDPYRILGLARGAPLDEVKRAYRRLAKANHPDAAGESALSRFLAIQAAYDQIAGPDAGSASSGGPGGPGRGAARQGTGPRRPWDAEPDRADATHRAYGGRARRARPASSRPGASAPGDGAGTASGTGPGASARREGTQEDEPGAGRRPDGEPPASGPPRPPKRATLGSTSYDGADAEPFEPDWGGASWYGTTSGTYWTLNPKEYADPRKHGPEYQARARRAAEAAEAVESAEGADTADASDAGHRPSAPSPERETPTEPTHTTSSWWDATAAAPTSDAPPTPAAAAPPWSRSSEAPRAATVAPSTSPWDAARWLETGSGGIVARVGRAVVGWAPIALGVGWLAGEITGCARFSADCDASTAPIAWFAQLVVLALLLLVPRSAAAASVATIATVAAAIPGSLLLTSMGGAADLSSGRAALGSLLVIGWVVGMGVGIAREARSLRDLRPTPSTAAPPVDDESGPVS